MPELGEIKVELLKKMVRQKRGGDSLRVAAKKIGVSAPTLQRIESGQLPNSTSLIKIAEWLGVSLDDLRSKPKSKQKRNTVEQIEVYLRADPNLDDDAAQTIADVVKQVYNGFKKKKKK